MRVTTWILVLLLALQIASCFAVSPVGVLYPAAKVADACNTWLEPDLETRETFWCGAPSQGEREVSLGLGLIAVLVGLASLLVWMLPTAMLSARWDTYQERRRRS